MKDFFQKYDHQIIPEPNTGCWLWIGAAISAGYGHGHRNMQHFYAHISAYESVHGTGSASGFIIRHQCDMPPCCNPDHLLKGSNRDNAMDSVRRGRANRARGENASKAKLTAYQVLSIRILASTGKKIGKIRRELGLTHVRWGAIKAAADRKTWKHLP